MEGNGSTAFQRREAKINKNESEVAGGEKTTYCHTQHWERGIGRMREEERGMKIKKRRMSKSIALSEGYGRR